MLTDVVYHYHHAGLSKRQRTRDLIKANTLRRIKQWEGKRVNGHDIVDVYIDDEYAPFPRIVVTGIKRDA